MYNITIVGWYGTETMGDVAIFDGILRVLSITSEKITVRLGSLFPFFTERTLFEEKEVFKKSGPNITIELFDEKDEQMSRSAISNSNLLIMGGGPLMDIEEVFLIAFYFKLANKKGIPTVIAGCGLGPLTSKEYIDQVGVILKHSSYIAWRDECSFDLARTLYPEEEQKMSVLGDPAIISIESFKNIKKNGNYVVVSLREYPEIYGKTLFRDELFVDMLDSLAKKFEVVKLQAMNMFFYGGDDRLYLESLKNRSHYDNIDVVHKPFNLEELYSFICNSVGCVGMRYHSVVMQTILNGNNYICDYTDPVNGKIVGFIKGLNEVSFYNDRYCNIHLNLTESLSKGVVRALQSNDFYKYRESGIFDNYKELISQFLR